MADEDYLGAFEQLAMLAIMRLRENAYGMKVRQEIEERIERSISIGAVYATLERLEKKGFLKSTLSDANESRSGRAKRFYRMETSGLNALKRSLRAVESMSKGLRELKSPIGEMS